MKPLRATRWALGVDGDRELRQGPGCRSEDHQTGVAQVEGRLMAGAEQVMGLLFPQADGTADVGADLGIAQDSTDSPVFAGSQES